MAYGDCSGEILPNERQVNCGDSVLELDDCCEVLMVEEEIMFFEQINKKGRKNYYYWFFLRADGHRLWFVLWNNLQKAKVIVGKEDEQTIWQWAGMGANVISF